MGGPGEPKVDLHVPTTFPRGGGEQGQDLLEQRADRPDARPELRLVAPHEEDGAIHLVGGHVLRAHRRYLGFPPPDVLVAPEDLAAIQQDRPTTSDPEPMSGDPAQRGADTELPPGDPQASDPGDAGGGERGAPTA